MVASNRENFEGLMSSADVQNCFVVQRPSSDGESSQLIRIFIESPALFFSFVSMNFFLNTTDRPDLFADLIVDFVFSAVSITSFECERPENSYERERRKNLK